MPIHIAPILRAREEAEEAAGLVVTLNSDGLNVQVNQENAGTTFRQSPKVTYLFNGKSYVPPQILVGT